MGRPVVATRVVGCIDAIKDGVTGTLVCPQDSAGLGQAISSYLQDPEKRALHGVAARQRVTQRFHQESVWAAILSEYRELLGERGLSLA